MGGVFVLQCRKIQGAKGTMFLIEARALTQLRIERIKGRLTKVE